MTFLRAFALLAFVGVIGLFAGCLDKIVPAIPTKSDLATLASPGDGGDGGTLDSQ